MASVYIERERDRRRNSGSMAGACSGSSRLPMRCGEYSCRMWLCVGCGRAAQQLRIWLALYFRTTAASIGAARLACGCLPPAGASDAGDNGGDDGEDGTGSGGGSSLCLAFVPTCAAAPTVLSELRRRGSTAGLDVVVSNSIFRAAAFFVGH